MAISLRVARQCLFASSLFFFFFFFFFAVIFLKFDPFRIIYSVFDIMNLTSKPTRAYSSAVYNVENSPTTPFGDGQ